MDRAGTALDPQELLEELLDNGETEPEGQRQWLIARNFGAYVEAVLALAAGAAPAPQPARPVSGLSGRFTADVTHKVITGGGGHIVFGTWRADDGALVPAVCKRITKDEQARPGDAPKEITLVNELRDRSGCPRANVVEYLAFGHWDAPGQEKNEWAVVMRRADLTLAGALAEPGDRLGARDTAALLLILARVLVCCQAKQGAIIHRDLKPANILLYKSEGAEGDAVPSVWRPTGRPAFTPVVADFGATREVRSTGETVTVMRGTDNYMPHEQRIGGVCTPHVDHYALGVIAFFCVTRRYPFGDVRDVSHQDQRQWEIEYGRKAPPTLSARLNGATVDPGFEAIVRRLLMKKPEKRYATAADLVADLEAYLAGRPVQAPAPGPELDDEDLKDGDPIFWAESEVARVERKRTRNRSRAAAAIAVLFLIAAAAAGVATWLFFGEQTAKTDATVAQTDATQTTAGTLDRVGEPGETAVLLAWALVGLKDADPIRARALRYGLATARNQIRPLRWLRNVNSNIRGCAISPDGTVVALGVSNNLVHFLDTRTGELLRDPGTGGDLRYETGRTLDDSIAAVAFSPDGTRLAVATNRGRVHVIDPATARPAAPPVEHDGRAMSVAFTPDGAHVVVASRKAAGPPLAMYRVSTGARARAFPLPYELYAAAVSGDGRWLAAAGGLPPEHALTVWDLTRPDAPPRELPQKTRLVALAFRPGAPDALAAGDFNGDVAFWDVARGQPDGAEVRHRNAVRFVSFSEDGRHLLVGGEDGSARLYDAQARVPVGQRFVHVDQVRAGAVTARGGMIVTSDFHGDVRGWALDTPGAPSQVLGHPGPVRVARFDGSGRYVLSGSHGGPAGAGLGRVWDWGHGACVDLPHGADVLAAQFRPGAHEVVTGANDGTATFWDAATGRPLQQLPRGGLIHALQFLGPDRLVLAGQGKSVRVFDRNRESHRFTAAGPLTHASYSFVWNIREGAGGAFFTDGGKVIIQWGPSGASYKERVLLDMDAPNSTLEVRLAAVEPLGHRAVVADGEGTTHLLDAREDPPQRALRVGDRSPHGTGRICADFSGATGLFATAGTDGAVRLWRGGGDLVDGPPMQHPSAVEVVCFSRDGRWLAAGCQDGGVRLWDVATATWTGAGWYHAGPVTSLEFSPDGTRVLSGGRDGLIRLVPLPDPAGGSAADLLDAVQADVGVFTERTAGGRVAAFVAPRPLSAEQFAEKSKARARLTK